MAGRRARNSAGDAEKTEVKKIKPRYITPNTGDTFNILPGCDKTINTCKYKFNNLNNYGNCPFIPNPDSSYGM